MSVRPIYKCHGGKYYSYEWIISNFPKNYASYRYFEGCGGAASVLLNKERSVEETYNDADPNLVRIVEALTGSDAQTFIERIVETPYNEEVFEHACKCLIPNDDILPSSSLAYYELIVRRMSRGGLRKSFAWSERKRGGRFGDVNAWETYKELLPQIVDRLKNVKVMNRMIDDLFVEYDASDTLWYIDPPYLHETRTSKDAYSVEMNEEDHIKLGELLNKAKGLVVLSGYQSGLYNKLYKGWNCACKMMANHSGQTKTKQKRIEVIWKNF